MRAEKGRIIPECVMENKGNEFLKDKKVMRLVIGGKSKKDYLEKLKADHTIKLTSQADMVMAGEGFAPSTNEPEHTINLVKVKVSDLVPKYKSANLYNIYAAARNTGLDLCPAEVGPELRLVNKRQAEHSWYLIGMNPIMDEEKKGHLFYLGNDGLCLNLHTDVTDKRTCYSKDIEFVFSFPQKPSK